MGYVYILLAGTFWSTIGFFSTSLSKAGLSTMDEGFLRLSIGCTTIFFYAIIKDRKLLKINKKGLIYSIIIGLVCQAMFNYCYMSSIKIAGSAVAAVLLYTSPIFVTIFSKLIYKEKINKIKIISLALCFVSAILAVTGGDLHLKNIAITGIITGILSAILYSLLPIISRNILNEISSLTMTMYAFLTGAIVFLLKTNFTNILNCVSHNPYIVINILCFGAITGALAYVCYTTGVQKGVELSVAGVLASIELVLAQIIGWTVMGENFNWIKILGVFLMIVSGIIAFKGVDDLKDDNIEEKNENEYNILQCGILEDTNI